MPLNEYGEEGIPLSLRNMHRGGCRICSIVISGTSSNLETQIALLHHVGRAHPERYLKLTGHMPTAKWLEVQEASMRHFAGDHQHGDASQIMSQILNLSMAELQGISDDEDFKPGGYL